MDKSDIVERLKSLSFRKKNQRGFTLIELVIVLIIIGILAGILLPKYQDLLIKAREAKLKALVSQIQTALKITFAQRMLDDTIPQGQKQPNVLQLADNVEGGDPEDDGIGVTISGEDYVIHTWGPDTCELARDGTCVGVGCARTGGTSDQVYCIAEWSPPVS